MAKELCFKIAGKDYGAAPVKLERKKIYGWTDIVATDRNGNVCSKAYLSPDDALVIPSGGLKPGVVDDTGRWVKKTELTPYSEDGKDVLPTYASSFDAPIEIRILKGRSVCSSSKRDCQDTLLHLHQIDLYTKRHHIQNQ